jgi:hypothetical protein
MISIQDMLKLKEQEMARLQKEIDALRLVASLYGEGAMIDASKPGEAMAQLSAQTAAAPAPQIFAPPVAVAAPPAPVAMLARNGSDKRFP